MAPVVTDTATPVPLDLLTPLRDHLPHSFSVLRRAQFSHRPQGTTPHARFLFASDEHDSDVKTNGDKPRHFAAAYLDLSQYPETQLYLYSTLQDASDGPDEDALLRAAGTAEDVERALDLVGALLARVRHIAAEAASPDASPAYVLPPPGPRREGLMVGGLHEATYRLLRARRGLESSYWNPHDVWLFQTGELPESRLVLPSGGEENAGKGLRQGQGQEPSGLLRWDVVRREDVPLIASRTKIPKVEGTLMSEPSVAVRDAQGGLVAWGFMGTAGTLSTLHVEVSGCELTSGPCGVADARYRSRIVDKALRRLLLQE